MREGSEEHRLNSRPAKQKLRIAYLHKKGKVLATWEKILLYAKRDSYDYGFQI